MKETRQELIIKINKARENYFSLLYQFHKLEENSFYEIEEYGEADYQYRLKIKFPKQLKKAKNAINYWNRALSDYDSF